MHAILARLRRLLRWRTLQRELDEELAQHRALRREALRRAGTPPAQLDQAAARAMGNEVYMREEARAVWLAPWLEAIGQGLRQGLARLARDKGFAAIAIVTLALGIGANTAIFSVVEAVMLRPLPYPHANHLVAFRFQSHLDAVRNNFTMAQVDFLRVHVPALAAAAGYRGDGVNELDHAGHTDWAEGELVTRGFFRVLGVSPRLGGGFTPADETGGAGGAVVLSDHLWRSRFGANPAVIGQTVRYGGQACTVVGVLPPDFTFLESPADIYVALQPQNGGLDQGFNTWLFARLRSGATLAQAQAQAAALTSALQSRGMLPPWAQGVALDGYQAQQNGPVRTILWFLLGVVGMLLLIACANVAGLLLARTLARAPELALRRALGAGGGRLFVQFLTEGVVLAAAGALAGLGLAAICLRALVTQLRSWNLPFSGPVSLDVRVLAFTVLVACGAALAFAAAAAWQGSARHLDVGRFRPRARNVMVAGEVALSLLLLAGAGLLLRSLASLEASPLGFDPAGRTIFAVQPPTAATRTGWALEQSILDRLRTLPGVAAAAAGSMLPLAGQGNLPAQPADTPADSASLEVRLVSPGYLAALGIPLLRGRAFSSSDTSSSPLVALASASLASAWFRGKPGGAVGGQVEVGVGFGRRWLPPPFSDPRQIVGIVGDVRTQSVNQPFRMTLYVPASQLPMQFGGNFWFVLRGNPSQAAIRAAVASVQPGARLSQWMPYPALVAQHLAQPRFEAQLTGIFALLALLLTAVGLYGLLSYTVTERAREIGVRLALGAPRGRLLRQVAARGMLLAAIGVAIGLALAVLLGHSTQSLLSGVKPNDPAALLGAALLLLAAAALACVGPAWRATRVDAARALRAD